MIKFYSPVLLPNKSIFNSFAFWAHQACQVMESKQQVIFTLDVCLFIIMVVIREGKGREKQPVQC